MDIKDNLIIKPEGKVQIRVWESNDPLVKLLNKFNAIVDNSKIIIAKCIGGNNAYHIDTIEVYALGVLLKKGIPVISFPISNKTEFFVEFDAPSFSGTVDEIRLVSGIGGPFSQITGISVIKSSTQNMSIKWTIEIL
jgi:hypothetical protein